MHIPDRFLVPDQNVMRAHSELAVHDARCVASGGGFLLPNICFYEMSTNRARARTTWEQSLRFFVGARARVFVGCNLHQAMAEEARTGTAYRSLVDVEATVTLRRILEAFERGDDAFLNRVFVDLASRMDSFADADRTERHKRTVLAHAKVLKERMPREWLLAIKKERVPALARVLASPQMGASVAELINEHVKDPLRAQWLMVQDSILATWIHVCLAWEIWWSALGGIESRDAKDLGADIRDLEYLHLAVLGGEIFSRERNVNALFTALVDGARLRNGELERCFDNHPELRATAMDLEGALLRRFA